MMQAKSIAIIGAGPSGLVAAKVFLDDGFEVMLFDRQRQLGGLWTEESAYVDLYSQQPGGTMEFSDLYDGSEFASWQHIHSYLQRYADKFRISERIRFQTRVVSVHKDELTNADVPWTVKVETIDGPSDTFEFDFVVVATGMYSKAHVPVWRGQEKFAGPILHASAVKSYEQVVDKRVVVVGGGKCATDMAVLAGHFARMCHLVFRRAHWMTPYKLIGGLLPIQILFTRLFTVPCTPFPDAPHSTLLRYIHQRFPRIFTKFFEIVSADIMAIHGPDLFNDKVFLPRGSYRNLENISIIPRDFIQLKRDGRIIGKLASIDHIVDETTIRLDSGEELQADMIIAATGFIERFPFFSEEHNRTMGLPTETIVTRTSTETDLNLYRRIVPVGVPNLAFVGFIGSVGQWMNAEVASHWISEYFLGRLKLPDSEAKMRDEIWKTRRFVVEIFNRTGNNINYYWLAPVEIYLNDMGLSLHRKNNWISEYFGIYRPERFKGLHEERRIRFEQRTTGVKYRRWYFGFGHTILLLFFLFILVFFFL